MSLRRVCDRCGFNEQVGGDYLPESWYRFEPYADNPHKYTQQKVREFCPKCVIAFGEFVDAIRNLPKEGPPR